MVLMLNALMRLEGLLVSAAEETEEDAFALQLEIIDMIPAGQDICLLERLSSKGSKGHYRLLWCRTHSPFAAIMVSARCCGCWSSAVICWHYHPVCFPRPSEFLADKVLFVDGRHICRLSQAKAEAS
jgi:hypothetical protein